MSKCVEYSVIVHSTAERPLDYSLRWTLMAGKVPQDVEWISRRLVTINVRVLHVL